MTKNIKYQNHPSLMRLPGEGILTYHFSDGSMSDDNVLRWSDCPIHQLVMLDLSIGRRRYRVRLVDCNNFVEFVQFKTAISCFRGTKCISRSIGYTDGEREYCLEINAATGEAKPKLYKTRIHFHPQSQSKK